MNRKTFIEEIKKQEAQIREAFPGMRLSKLRYVDIKHAHISTVRSAHKWMLSLLKSKEYLSFYDWWIEATPQQWKKYEDLNMVDIYEYKEMHAARCAFQDMMIKTTPRILWSKKRINNAHCT